MTASDTAPETGASTSIARRLAAHPFCTGMDAGHIEALADITTQTALPRDAFVFRFGRPADTLYLLDDGDISLEIGDPGRDAIVMETLSAGDMLGWSWLFPPQRWHHDARCRTDVTVLGVDAAGLRAMMDDDPAFGFEIALCIGGMVVDRLENAHAQIATVSHHDAP